MSYESTVTIIKGIRVDKGVILDDCQRFIKMKPHSILAKNTKEYFEVDEGEEIWDYMADYMHDISAVLEDEFLDATYYGTEVLSIGQTDKTEGYDLAEIANAKMSDEMQEFLSTLYPDEEVKYWIIHHVY